MKDFVLKGSLCFSTDANTMQTMDDGYLVCENGRIAGVFSALPAQYAALPLLDYTGKLILPGMTDLHVHAPQFAFRGLGMDLELLEWLNTYTFPEEAKYARSRIRRPRIFQLCGPSAPPAPRRARPSSPRSICPPRAC